jgi:tRNA(Ile)-lysidine synthase
VAVSGGADSVALLRAVHSGGISPIAAHVNHKLRGADSDADEAFVVGLCAELGTVCRVRSIDVAALAAGANLEATARRVRYEFFTTVAAEVGAAWIATAHTASDQAETVLHRVIRGTGIQGLRGIATESEASATTRLVRPLLGVTRAEVLAYLAAIGQPYREDASNADLKFTRNRIRHELLPLLRSFNPDVVMALVHLAEHATEAHEVLAAAGADLVARMERPRAAGAIVLDAATLRAARKAVRRAALRLVWEREHWPVSEMTFDAWDRAVEIVERDTCAGNFPGGVVMRAVGRVVQLTRET